MRPALLIEGNCPWGHGPLERREHCGWCAECGAGFSVERSRRDPTRMELTLHSEVEFASRSGEQPPPPPPGSAGSGGGTNEGEA